MSAPTETTSSPTLVGFPSHLTPSATFRPSQCNPSPKLERHLKKFGLNQLIWTSLMMPIRLKLPSLSSNGLSTHQNWCTEKPSLMNTALTMLVEPRLKQAIHLVSSEHQNSPHIVKMSSIHIYSFLPCIFFYARKTYHPLLAIWRHVLFAFYIALLRIKPSHVFQPIWRHVLFAFYIALLRIKPS